MKKILISLIDLYQKMPLVSHKSCRFIPTCSNYAKESINTYGAFRGRLMAIKRILKCNPFGPSGYDPVPEKRRKNNEKF